MRVFSTPVVIALVFVAGLAGTIGKLAGMV